MKKLTSIEIRVRVRWWVKHYIQAIALFAVMNRQQPDLDRIGKFITKHGIKLEVK